jgi:hypothetical protein
MQSGEKWNIEGQSYGDSNMWKLHSIFKGTYLEAKEKAATVFCKTHYASIRVVKHE